MTRIAVLITCFNRCEKTVACLRSLYGQQFVADVQLQVYLLDAGHDQTSTVVAAQFPSVVLLQGDEQLFWAGGMRLAWQQALLLSADFYLWLNDDVQLEPDAVSRLFADYQQLMASQKSSAAEVGAGVGAVIGTMVSMPPYEILSMPSTQPVTNVHRIPGQPPATVHLTYGGRRSCSRWFPLQFGPVLMPTAEPQSCDFINGNLCLIPAAAVQTIGILSPRYTHSMADYDYGLRLKSAGFSLWVGSGFHGRCAMNDPAASVLNKNRPFAARLKSLQRPNVWAPANEWAYFVRCHGGPFWPLLWLKVKLRGWFPALWLWWSQREISE